MSVRLPDHRDPITDKNGKISPVWHVFLSGLPNFVPVPQHHNSPGTQGQMAVDTGTGKLYVCYATNSWAEYDPTSIVF